MSAPLQRSRGGAVLIAALVVDSVGNGLFLPLSLIFFLQLTDVRLALLGVLISAANAITLPIPIWAGAAADRIGALPLVIGAQVLQGLGYLSYPWVQGPAGIFVASSLIAVGVRIFWSTIFTAIADFADSSPARMSKDSWFAWSTMARTAGLGLGGLATGIAIADGRDGTYHAIAYVAAACFFLAAMTIGGFVRAPRRPRPAEEDRIGYREVLRDRQFLALIGINTVFAMSSMMLALALPTFLTQGLGAPAWLSSAILVANTVLLTVLTAAVVKRLAPYRRTRVIMVAALLWTGWCAIFAVLGPDRYWLMIPLLLVATAAFTAAELLHAPVSMALATAVAPEAARGRYLAAFQYSFTFAGLIAPVFFASLFEVHRSLPWIALGVVNALALIATRRLESTIPADAQRDRPGVVLVG